MRAIFPTKALRDEAVEKYHAIEGGQQQARSSLARVFCFYAARCKISR